MVVSVTGNVDGVDLIFEKVGVDQWQITVPPNFEDNRYIVEIWVADEAGNIGYFTAILHIHDGRVIYFEIIEDSFLIKILATNFEIFMVESFMIRLVVMGFECRIHLG